jgi:hypothetical protein
MDARFAASSRQEAMYRRLTQLDQGYADRGDSVERRRARWAALDRDPTFQRLLQDPSLDSRIRERLRSDLTECRRIRDTAFEQGSDWTAASIYEALLALFFLIPSGDDYVFRGHLDADWRLVPSFFRMKPKTSILLQARVVYGAYRWAERRVRQSLDLTPFGAEAAAQHYGSGTTLLDVTESLRVAAYFATTPLRPGDQQADFGSIYVLNVDTLSALGHSVLRGRSLPPALLRIHRTQGAFVSGVGMRDDAAAPVVRSADDIIRWMNESEHQISRLDEVGLGIEASLLGASREIEGLRFRQTGECFRDALWGVSRAQLRYEEGVTQSKEQSA